MIYIGIDPGQQGAVSGLFIGVPGAIKKYFAVDMPKTTIELKRIINLEFVGLGEGVFCMLEAAQPMPKQGVKGVFTYGIGFGKIIAVLEILEIPFQTIHPAIWKKEFSLIKKDKKASVKVAQQLFPNIEFYTERGRMLDGRAEALLLAEYGRRTYEGISEQKTKKKISKKSTS